MRCPTWARLIFLLFGIAAARFAIASDTLTQTESERQADSLYHDASEADLRHAAVNAMRAMTSLGQGNLLAAYRVGTTAFGQWSNSNDLDYASMTAANAGQNLGATQKESASRSHGFSRLTPNFLYEGDAALAAAEFEKTTGMKRETFLKRLADANDHPIPMNDPHMISKYVERVDALTKDMTNTTVKSVFQKTLHAIPLSWLDVTSAAVKNSISSAMRAPAALAQSETRVPAASSVKIEKVTQTSEAAPLPDRSAITETKSQALPSKEAIAQEGQGVVNTNFMKEILFSEQQEGEDSLFRRVRARYQSLAVLFR